MNAGWWAIFEFILCIVEIVLSRMLLLKFGKSRFDNKVYEGLAVLGSAMTIYVKGYFNSSFAQDIILGLIIITIYSICICEMTWYNYLVFSSIFVLLVISIDFGVTVFIQLLLPLNVFQTFMQSRLSRFICAILSKMVLLVSIMIMPKKNGEENLSVTSLILLFGAVIISFVCIYSIIRIEEIRGFQIVGNEDFSMCFLTLGIFSMDIMIYIVIQQLNERINKEKQLELVQYQNELLEKMVLENKEVEKEWRKNRHDFNNHLSCVDMLLQMQNITKARSYIQNLTQSYLGNTLIIKVGNEIADAVINQKYIFAKQKGIDFKVEGSLDDNYPIEQMDLCALLSNSLDNAIEAAQKVDIEEKRFVQLFFRVYHSYLIIEVVNSVKENIKSDSVTINTTKKNTKHHGIGMTSMLTTVEKYKGHMEWKCKDYCFSLVLLFPMARD